MKHKTYTVEHKAIDIEAGVYEAMISTEERDRDGDIMIASGVLLENYLKNPVVLFGHNYREAEAVVGKALEVEPIDGVGVRARWQFVDADTNPQADIVRRLWAGEFLNATSVGFIPKQQTPFNEEDPFAGSLISQWELLEFSIVPVPANQSALRLAIKTLGGNEDDEPDTIKDTTITDSDDGIQITDEPREQDADTEPIIDDAGDGGNDEITEPEPELDEATLEAIQGAIDALRERLI